MSEINFDMVDLGTASEETKTISGGIFADFLGVPEYWGG